MKKFIALFLAVATLFCLVACAAKETTTTEQPTAPAQNTEAAPAAAAKTETKAAPTVIKVATSESIVKTDPHNQQGWPGNAGIRMVMEALVATDHQGNYSPLLAESWTISDDQTEMTFKLYDGIKTHNGYVVNADDVVATYTRLLTDDTLALNSAALRKWKSVEKVDDLTVKFTFTEPDSQALMYIAQYVIFEDEQYAQYGEAYWIDQHMDGTGPWVWGEWVDGQYLYLTRNDNYWKGDFKSEYEEFYMYFLTEESSAIAAHLAGTIDAYISVGGISADNLPLYDGFDTQIITMPTSLYYFIGFCEDEGRVFRDPDLRRAFSMSFDREEVGLAICGDGIEVAKTIPSFSFTMGYDDSYTSPYYKYDPDAAKALIEASGYDGAEINFLIGSNVPHGEEIGLVISEKCQAIGMNVKVELADISTFQDRRRGAAYDCYITTDGLNYGECYGFYNTRLISDAHKHLYKQFNDEFVALADKCSRTLDTNARNDLYKQVNAILGEDCPIISLFCTPKTYAINHGIEGIDLYSDGSFDFRYITCGE